MLSLVCALTPLGFGLLTALMKKSRRKARMAVSLLGACLTSALVLWRVMSPGEEALELFRLNRDFVCVLQLDQAGKVYIGLAALLWPMAVLYAVEYMAGEEREGHFFSWYLFAYAASVLLSAAGNLFTLYVFYEFLTLCTVPLVWHKQDGESTAAAFLYILYLLGGAALGFVALMLLPALGGGEGAFLPGGIAALRDSEYLPWLAVIGFVGFGAKAAVLPLCRWLPTASVAPTPVTALLHAVAVVNAGVFSVMRFLYYILPAGALAGSWAQQVMLALSALTVLYGAAMAVRENHVKRRLAWSTVSNLSYMLFGLALLTPRGMAAGLSHMVFHGLMKIILFFCAGAVMVQTGRTRVREMHGLGGKMPWTFLAFTLAGVSLLGVPPLPGFVGKYALITAALEAGGTLPLTGAVAILAAAVLTAVYIFTVVYPAFFMAYHPYPGEKAPRDPGTPMKLSLALLCLTLLLASVFAGRVMDFLNDLAGGVGV